MDKKKFKEKLLQDLYEPYKNCHACPLGNLGRKNVVFGEGNPDTRLLFIGEAPGKDEDEQGRPFVGRSGQLLNKVLEACGISREDIFITNIVKCRPPNNRLPHPSESSICKSILLYNQIKIIRPKIICTLGSHALQSLIGDEIDEILKITKVRGKIFKKDGILIIPTYHPAYILRNKNELETFMKDITLVKNTLINTNNLYK